MIPPVVASLQTIRNGTNSFRRILVAFTASLAELDYFDLTMPTRMKWITDYFNNIDNYTDQGGTNVGLCREIRNLADCVPDDAIGARIVKLMFSRCGDPTYPEPDKFRTVMDTINNWTVHSSMESRLLPGTLDDVHIIMYHTAETVNLNNKSRFPAFSSYTAIMRREFFQKYGRPIGSILRLQNSITAQYISDRSHRLLDYYSGGDAIELIKTYRTLVLNSAPVSSLAQKSTPSKIKPAASTPKITLTDDMLFANILTYFLD
jgi:hypothetical protein